MSWVKKRKPNLSKSHQVRQIALRETISRATISRWTRRYGQMHPLPGRPLTMKPQMKSLTSIKKNFECASTYTCPHPVTSVVIPFSAEGHWGTPGVDAGVPTAPLLISRFCMPHLVYCDVTGEMSK